MKKATSQIFKEADTISEQELALLGEHIIKRNDDKANGIIAFEIDMSYDEADDLVCDLNELDDGDWYVGDEEEEYVNVD